MVSLSWVTASHSRPADPTLMMDCTSTNCYFMVRGSSRLIKVKVYDRDLV